MSRTPIVEPMYSAYSRYRVTHHHTGWGAGDKHPFVMRGETELHTSMIPDRQYNKMLNSITRGYLQEHNTMIPSVVKMAMLATPFQRFPMGYLGKTRFTLYMPSQQKAFDLKKELLALNTMVDAIRPKSISVAGSSNWGFYGVECYEYVSSWDNRGASRYGSPTHQLKPLFTQLRTIINEQMKRWLPLREPFVEWLRERPVITIPFDSTANRKAYTKRLEQGEASE